jgi:hypothetical protein
MMIIIMVVVVMREKNMYVKENKMRETLENLSEGSTLQAARGHQRSNRFDYKSASRVGLTDDVCHRGYGDPSMTGTWQGRRDSKNMRLNIHKPEVQVMRSVVTQGNNRCEGDWRRGMSMAAYNGDMIRTRVASYDDVQPVGCNGPVICDLGLKMKQVIVAHNNYLPVLAAESEAFSQGGVFVSKDVGVSHVGAGESIPTNQDAGGSRLNNAVGLNFAITIGPGSAVSSMQKQNFVGGVSNGAGGF